MTQTIPQARAAGDADITEPGATSSGLLVLTPLRFEARAVRRGLRETSSRVQRTGMGATRARKKALLARGTTPGTPDMGGSAPPIPPRPIPPRPGTFGTLIVMGTAAGLSD